MGQWAAGETVPIAGLLRAMQHSGPPVAWCPSELVHQSWCIRIGASELVHSPAGNVRVPAERAMRTHAQCCLRCELVQATVCECLCPGVHAFHRALLSLSCVLARLFWLLSMESQCRPRSSVVLTCRCATTPHASSRLLAACVCSSAAVLHSCTAASRLHLHRAWLGTALQCIPSPLHLETTDEKAVKHSQSQRVVWPSGRPGWGVCLAALIGTTIGFALHHAMSMIGFVHMGRSYDGTS